MLFFRKICFLLVILLVFLTVEAQKIDSIKKTRPTVALVLSGGGAKGFAEIGTLEAIDELGIPIDYIVGTSMGSIMGGFYAIGYSGKQIAEEVVRQNWNTVFTDAIVSGKTPISIKDELSRYVFTFPMRGGIRLPQGIVRGQQVMDILTKYAIDYHNTSDFLKLPIPYSCVATDLETGEAIVLDKGYLPQAMRASMAIPSVFTPVEIDDRIFVDGGTVDNFPTDVAKAKGVDYIIGVNVQSGLRTKKELNSAIAITNQLVTLLGKTRNDENIKLADVYIHPNVRKYSTSSFTNEEIDSLIAIGRRAAKKAYPKLQKLKEKLGKSVNKKQLPAPKYNQKFHFNAIRVEGVEQTGEKLFFKKLKLQNQDSITPDALNAKMADVSAALNLDLLTYKLTKDTLVFTAHERNSRRFNVGMHYDSDNNAAVLLNTTWDNLLLKNSRTSLDAILGKNLQFTARYTLRFGDIPHLNFMFDTKKYDLTLHKHNDRLAEGTINYFKFDTNMQFVAWDNYSAGIGFRTEYLNIDQTISNNEDYSSAEKLHKWYANYYGFIRLNTLDNIYYPKRGTSYDGEVKFVSDGVDEKGLILYASYKRAINISPKIGIIANLYGRTLIDNTLNPVYSNYWGGFEHSKYLDKQIPFVGANWAQGYNNMMAVGRLDFRYELFRNNYLILRGNYGRYSDVVEDFLKDAASDLWGGGITYSYNSIIGPIEFTVMHSNAVHQPLVHINIGYNF